MNNRNMSLNSMFIPQVASALYWMDQSARHCVLTRCSRSWLQGLVNLVWALAKLKHRDDQLMEAVAWQAYWKLNSFGPQELANAVWAFATLGCTNAPLFESVAKRVVWKASAFNPIDFANVAWAFARAGQYSPAMYCALGRAALAKLPSFNAQQLANVAWGFASSGHQVTRFAAYPTYIRLHACSKG